MKGKKFLKSIQPYKKIIPNNRISTNRIVVRNQGFIAMENLTNGKV